MNTIRGVAEIVINVSDVATTTQFYQQVLGFSLHSQFPETNPTIVFLAVAELDSALGRRHPQMLALIDVRRHPPARDRFQGLDRRTSTLNHLAFEIDPSSYDAELQRLGKLGMKTKTVNFPHMQAKAIFFEDPEGNLLELICHDGQVSDEECQQAVKETSQTIEDLLRNTET